MPPPVDPAAPVTLQMSTTPATLTAPMAPVVWTNLPPTPATRVAGPPMPEIELRPMAPWRLVGAGALTATFALMGWQVQRLIDDRPWSDPIMWLAVLTGVVAAGCVLGWTWMTTSNARRLIGPANRANIPDPAVAVRTWIVPFVFIAIAVAVVAVLGIRANPVADGDSEATVSSVPLAVAVVALLLAIPMTYRPMYYLAGVVRQVGGYTVRVAQWMWVPVVMAVVGVGSIVALRFAGVDDASDAATGTDAWVPLWVVAVVAILPCVVTIVLAWRAASAVEDAVTVAAARRRPGGAPPPKRVLVSRPASRRRVAPSQPISLLPGAEALQLVIVTLVAGLALLSLVGAIVTGLLWMETRDVGVIPAERQRAWEALDALRAASTGVGAALLATAVVWMLVTVVNVRRISGRQFTPVVAVLCLPLATFAVWRIADRMIVDASIGRVIAGFAAQAAVLAVPLVVLERYAEAIGARRTPLRIVYVLAVVLLVHVQGLGGLLRLPESVTSTEIGRLAGYLAIGALIQLCSTLAVTDACRAISQTCRHEADHHNMLVESRNAARPAAPATVTP